LTGDIHVIFLGCCHHARPHGCQSPSIQESRTKREMCRHGAAVLDPGYGAGCSRAYEYDTRAARGGRQAEIPSEWSAFSMVRDLSLAAR
jgi:hypothetical protein